MLPRCPCAIHKTSKTTKRTLRLPCLHKTFKTTKPTPTRITSAKPLNHKTNPDSNPPHRNVHNAFTKSGCAACSPEFAGAGQMGTDCRSYHRVQPASGTVVGGGFRCAPNCRPHLASTDHSSPSSPPPLWVLKIFGVRTSAAVQAI